MLRPIACVLAILMFLLPTVVRAEEAPAPSVPMSEAQFIALAGAEPPGEGNTPPEPSRPMEPAKATEEAKGDDEEAPDEDDDAGSDDDEPEETAADEEEPAAKDDDEEEEEEEVASTEPTAEEDAAFRKALAEEGVHVTLEDIPEEARPLVEKKLKDLERGFHAQARKTAEERKAASAFRIEERFRKEHEADFIVQRLRSRPALADEVNEIIGNLEGNPTAVKGHDALVEQARREAATAEEAEDGKAAAHAERIENYVRQGRAAARAAGVPFDMGVEEAMAARLALGEELSEADIRTIAKQKAAIYQRQLRQDQRDKRGKYVADKVADRKKAGLKVKPGVGHSPSPGAKRVPKNDQEFIDEFVARGG